MGGSRQNKRDGVFAIVGGLAIAAVGGGFALAGYGWLYAVWFAWISPVLIGLGVLVFLGRGPKKDSDLGL
ncbi:hypothetical protein [Microbacterium sulfonylureivorans]|uniref:hypothetical protein n=1 Tax=Microbacterium sulfonylureivorans TaxID=2486854 RepID=UPI0013DF28DD|nr:hypothetical protein [Microbacterium sulfonylureivorans]